MPIKIIEKELIEFYVCIFNIYLIYKNIYYFETYILYKRHLVS